MTEEKQHEDLKTEMFGDIDEMFKQADRRMKERDEIISQWMLDEITSEEFKEKISSIKYYD